MHTETKNNTQQIASPPLPPAAVFDEQHMASAQPVQPLRIQQSRKIALSFQSLLRRRFTALVTAIAGMIICVGIGAASVDWASPVSSKDDTAQAASEFPAPPTAPSTSNDSAVKRQDPKRRSHSNPQARESLPRFDFDDAEDYRKPRARMISVIH